MSGFVRSNAPLAPVPIIVCNEDHRFLVAEQIKSVVPKGASIILEPCGRNTAPALTVAAIHATKNRQDQLLLVMPADHVITDIVAFHHALSTGIEPALGGAIVTFGIVPNRPETGYGYIQANQQTRIAERAYPITRFVEKPDRETAERYLAQGNYYWNSGMFLLRAGIWLTAMEQFQPAMLTYCIDAFSCGNHDLDFLRLDRETFSSCPADSIDYAVMEKLTTLSDASIRGIVVPMNAGWSDVGSWDAVWGIAEKDGHGNSSSGDVITEDTCQSLVLATSRLVTCVGIDGLVVVETPDAVLVAKKNKAQDVKKIVMTLKANARRERSAHRRVYRPWGWYDSLEQGEGFQVKHILVKPGAVLSLQLHRHRSEHWVVIHGTAKVTRGDETIVLNKNQSVFIPVGEKHRVENPGKLALEFIEIQSGSYLGEDDIVRLEDRYGRA
ncbi:MAG: Alginate biosynthesis protein AlgA [Syntrophorhabdus sp. PtaU1.Bin153]|nr:MAG: Alginate biosynthesis protein AlgA [Syntrophorhabdus sp. PtaU1.Bin153]